MIDNDPNLHWFAPFELTFEDNNENEYKVMIKYDYCISWKDSKW